MLDISVLGLATVARILTENRSKSRIPIPHGPSALAYLLYKFLHAGADAVPPLGAPALTGADPPGVALGVCSFGPVKLGPWETAWRAGVV